MSEKAAMPPVRDLAKELAALEELFRDAQEKTHNHLALAMEEFSKALPLSSAGRRLKKSMGHQLMVLAELSAVSVGLSNGFISIFRTQLEQETSGEN